MEVFDGAVVLGHINFAKSRHDGIQQTVLVFHDDEESRIETKELDAPSQGALGVNGQAVGIKEHNGLEFDVGALDVGLGEKLEFFANKLDALAVGAVDKHDIGLNLGPQRVLVIVVID